MPTKPEKDHLTGQETTGHEWDGIKELNTPLPKWWLYVFYASIVFAVVYMVLYPSIPWLSGHTDGLLGWDRRVELQEDIKQAFFSFDWEGTGLEEEFGKNGEEQFIEITFKEYWEVIRKIDAANNVSYNCG